MHKVLLTKASAVLFFVASLGVCSAQISTSSVAQRDPTAVTVVTKAIVTMGTTGGAAAISAIQDWTANGSVTFFYWKDNDPQGTFTAKGRGLYQFRIDSALPDGAHGWIVSNGAGLFENPNGTTKPIPNHDAVALGTFTLPVIRLAVALADPTYSLSCKQVQNGSQQFYQVSVAKTFSSQEDPDGGLSKLETFDFFIDANTYLITGVHNGIHPPDFVTISIPHDVYYSNYQPVNGILVPFSINEFKAGQKVWSLQVSSVQFNTGLTDADFKF